MKDEFYNENDKDLHGCLTAEEKYSEEIKKLHDVIENPGKYTRVAKISFDERKFKTGSRFDIVLTYDNGQCEEAVLDPDCCVEFGVLLNNELYNIIVVEISGEKMIFDYSIVNKSDIYNLAEEHSLLLDTGIEYKTAPKIAYDITGQIGNIERNGTECCIYSFDNNTIYQWLIINDETLKSKVTLKPGAYMKMTVLQMEFSLDVIDCIEIPKPDNAHRISCFSDYKGE